ncbi:MAG: hypothetical protein V4556_13810 [Bacteroidota bacterium]
MAKAGRAEAVFQQFPTGADMQPSNSVGVSVPNNYFQIENIKIL